MHCNNDIAGSTSIWKAALLSLQHFPTDTVGVLLRDAFVSKAISR